MPARFPVKLPSGLETPSGIGSRGAWERRAFLFCASAILAAIAIYIMANQMPRAAPDPEAADGWWGVVASRRASAEIIKRLNSEINAIIVDPAIQPRLADLGISPKPMPPADFGKFIAADSEKWAKIIKVANIKAD